VSVPAPVQAGFSPEPGYVFGKDFRVVRPLRSGGMGSVFVVEQLSTGKQRALKLLNPAVASDPTIRDRFVFEARAASAVESDHVVEVVTAGIDEQHAVPYLVMELLRGEDLADRISRAGPMPIEDVVEVISQVGHALERAHEQGIVHRDLKPENIFLAESRRKDTAFTAKILDFGVAKLVVEGSKKKSGTQPIGSPWYMAPEQTDWKGGIYPGTDVWALGLIAYVCLTGREYWREVEALAVLMREIVLEPIPPASERAAEFGLARLVPAGFDVWFARCLERDLKKRYPEAGECVRAFVERFQRKQTPAGLYIELPNARASQAPGAPTPAPAAAPAAAPKKDLTLEMPKGGAKEAPTAPAAPMLGGLELDFDKAATSGKGRTIATPAPRSGTTPMPTPAPAARSSAPRSSPAGPAARSSAPSAAKPTPAPMSSPFDDDDAGPASFELAAAAKPPPSLKPAPAPTATPTPAPAAVSSRPQAAVPTPRVEAAKVPTPAPAPLSPAPAAPVVPVPEGPKTLYDRIKRPLILVYVAFGVVVVDIILGRVMDAVSPLHSAWLAGPLFLIGAVLVGLEIAKAKED